MEDTYFRLLVRERLAEAERIGYHAVRVTAPEPLSGQAARPERHQWLRVSLPVPALADSRAGRAVLSTSLLTDWLRVLDTIGLVAAAAGGVALLSVLCR
jgi:hypothetical protein